MMDLASRILACSDVAVHYDADLDYPDVPPFHPAVSFPEYPFREIGIVDADNPVYGAVRDTLAELNLDADRFGSPDWNPLGVVVRPGDTVVVKPNAVQHLNLNPRESVFAVITHGSVIRAIIDYVFIALQGRGKIIVADAPLVHADFEEWRRLAGVDAIVDLYRRELGFEVEVLDLRNLYVPWDYEKNYPPSGLREQRDRDPAGYAVSNLGALSAFTGMPEADIKRMVGSDPDRRETVRHHLEGRHEYCVSKTILSADVLISVPKLKVHRLVGMTVNLKGMVGTQGDKNYIPHYRLGTAKGPGDEYPDMGAMQNAWNRLWNWMHLELLARQSRSGERLFEILSPFHQRGQQFLDLVRRGSRAVARRVTGRESSVPAAHIIAGGWWGNDTAWRMALDLTRIVLYADQNGILREEPQRRFFSLVDGVVGGEQEGPLAPAARREGVLLAGFNPLAVDLAATRLVGFDPLRVRMLHEGLRCPWLHLWEGGTAGVRVRTNQPEWASMFAENNNRFIGFRPPEGWEGRIEVGPR